MKTNIRNSLKARFCPIVQKAIEELTCYDVSMSAEEMQPARFAPKEFRETKNWKEICISCSEHTE